MNGRFDEINVRLDMAWYGIVLASYRKMIVTLTTHQIVHRRKNGHKYGI